VFFSLFFLPRAPYFMLITARGVCWEIAAQEGIVPNTFPIRKFGRSDPSRGASLHINPRVPIIFLAHVGKIGPRSAAGAGGAPPLVKIRQHTRPPPRLAPLSWQYPAQHALLENRVGAGTDPGGPRRRGSKLTNWANQVRMYRQSRQTAICFLLPYAHSVTPAGDTTLRGR